MVVSKIALVIIFNHRFDKNIEVLESIYRGRFSHIFHLMPFYDGDKENVIPVYENSHYFQGYVAQGFSEYFDVEFTHYLFIADDCLLNPKINETNYAAYFKVAENTSFIPKLITLHEREEYWTRVREAFQYRVGKSGVEATHELPSYQVALERFARLGLEIHPLNLRQLQPPIHPSPSAVLSPRGAYRCVRRLLRTMKSKLRREVYELSYPLVGSYGISSWFPKVA